MIAVIFEVVPAPGKRQDYLDLAASLKSELERMDGFISIERYASLTNEGKILSLSIWRDEDAVKRWRNLERHRAAQAKGRAGIFADYRLRVASVIRDYSMVERDEAPEDSRKRLERAMNAGEPLDEYKIACEFLRSYATLRFLRFTVLLGATGGLIGTIVSETDPTHILVLKLGGLGLTLAFGIMDYSASVAWHRLRSRANALAASMQFQPFSESSPWNPLTTTGASRYLHLFLASIWVFVLLRG
jgi:heme-degrading monooxygenase HmoA